jgi:hypothetical protein
MNLSRHIPKDVMGKRKGWNLNKSLDCPFIQQLISFSVHFANELNVYKPRYKSGGNVERTNFVVKHDVNMTEEKLYYSLPVRGIYVKDRFPGGNLFTKKVCDNIWQLIMCNIGLIAIRLITLFKILYIK